MIVVADSGPIIHLARVNQLTLLWTLYETVVIPRQVFDEVVIAGQGRPGSDEAARLIHADDVRQPGPRFASLRTELKQLGAGEVSAICCALDLHADLVLMDDFAARRAAQLRGLTVKGTLGVLIEAKSHGLIPNVADTLNDLLKTGAWLDPALMREALRLAGELP
jgi:predicted nucleic acid-binding protein